MTKLPSLIFLVASVAAFTGCAYLTLPPAPDDDRIVTTVSNREKTVSIKEPMAWGDQKPVLTRGIGLPSGVYVLEAEDSQYLYFRSPKPLEYRAFRQGETIEDRFKKGGLFLSKSGTDLVRAGAYLSSDDSKKKTLIWKLGNDFLREEGSRWTKSF